MSRMEKIVFGFIFGLVTALNPYSLVNSLSSLAIVAPLFIYVFYISLFGYISRGGHAISNNYKKIVRPNVFFFYFVYY